MGKQGGLAPPIIEIGRGLLPLLVVGHTLLQMLPCLEAQGYTGLFHSSVYNLSSLHHSIMHMAKSKATLLCVQTQQVRFVAFWPSKIISVSNSQMHDSTPT